MEAGALDSAPRGREDGDENREMEVQGAALSTKRWLIPLINFYYIFYHFLCHFFSPNIIFSVLALPNAMSCIIIIIFN